MKELISILLSLVSFGLSISVGQVVNNITILPSNPLSNDTILLVSDFSYYGNCSYGLVNTTLIPNRSTIKIQPEYCGFGAPTLCQSIDTFYLGVLPPGNNILQFEYHQGSICPISGFDTIIANTVRSVEIGLLSAGSPSLLNKAVSIFPNPTADLITLKSTEPIEQIQLFDSRAKEIKVSLCKGQIALSALHPAVYILSIRLANGVLVKQKIVKINAE